MNQNDLIKVRGNQVTLRLVLGLMESAEHCMEAYQWATTGLIHAFHTSDKELCRYIDSALYKKGLRPYEIKEEELDDKPVSINRSITNDQHILASAIDRLTIKMVLDDLMALKDGKGHPLFSQKNHWWVVYRLFIDKNIYQLKENKYKEFISLIESLNLTQMNAELDMATLSNISQEDIYRKPFKKWRQLEPQGEGSRKLTAYKRMLKLGEELNKIITERAI
jgi:hypothetical protein